MGVLFHKKSTAILTIAAILLVVLLVCALLITLSQMMSLNSRAQSLSVLVKNILENNADKQELLDFMKTDEYVVRWAELQGLVEKSQISYIISGE